MLQPEVLSSRTHTDQCTASVAASVHLTCFTQQYSYMADTLSAMCHVRTALSVTDPSLPPVRVHGMSCRSIYVTLGYRWLLSMNISRPTYSLPHFETTAHLWHLWFLCAAYKCTYLLTYYAITSTIIVTTATIIRAFAQLQRGGRVYLPNTQFHAS